MNTDNTRDTEIIEEGREAVLSFDFYIDLLTTGQIADSKRFNKEFFEAYPYVKENSPFHMMFCAFVGALDLVEASEKAAEERAKKESSDATTETTK